MPGAASRDGVVVAGLGCDFVTAGAFLALVADRTPILVVRGEDGVLRATASTCRHGDPLVVAERAGPGMTSTGAFTCPFAGWPGPHDGSGRMRALPAVESHGVVLVRPGGGAPTDPDTGLDARVDAGLDDGATDRLDRLSLDQAVCVDTAREIVARGLRSVVDELRARPGTFVVAGHAVIEPAAGGVVLWRVFPLTGDESVVDRRTYRVGVRA